MIDLVRPHTGRIAELWRYYKVGVVNTVVGYGLYALLVAVHVNLFVAQILAHVCGAIFNYFTFSKHVFHGHKPRLGRYILSYGFNYLLGLAALIVAHRLIRSPYLDGLVALVFVSAINYLVLKFFVFARPSDQV
ncbi:MAG: GtrA family protein [Caulobacteraceae bacterium]|nr:GtrA family protein [Caulobacteraceae bacterium]